jgi:hypothetical protein
MADIPFAGSLDHARRIAAHGLDEAYSMAADSRPPPCRARGQNMSGLT